MLIGLYFVNMREAVQLKVHQFSYILTIEVNNEEVRA